MVSMFRMISLAALLVTRLKTEGDSDDEMETEEEGTGKEIVGADEACIKAEGATPPAVVE